MTNATMSGANVALFVAGMGALGVCLCLLSELLIVRFVPRLGGMPGTGTRILTAGITGVLCATMALRIGFDAALPAFLAFSVLAVQLARMDLTQHLLPNPLVLALLGSGLMLLFIGSAFAMDWSSMIRAFAGAVVLFLAYLALAVMSPSGIGMGDVKLAGPLGLYLGYLGWSALFYGGALGFILGGLVSAGLLATKRITKNEEVAFGPSMLAAAIGTIVVAW